MRKVVYKRKVMANTQKKSEMPNAHLHQLFVDELRDVLGAERQLLKGLKKLSTAAKSDRLRKAFQEHHGQTEQAYQTVEGCVRIYWPFGPRQNV